MQSLTFFLLALSPLVAHALPQAGKSSSCNIKTATVTHTVFLDPTTVIVPAPPAETSSSAAAAVTQVPVGSDTTAVHIPTARPSTPSSVPFSNETTFASTSTLFDNQTALYPSSSAPASSSELSASVPVVLSSSSFTSASVSSTKLPTPTADKKPVSSSSSSSVVAPTYAAPSSSSKAHNPETSTSSAAASPSASADSDGALIIADATVLASSPAATSMCGDADRKIMPGYPWTVSNAMYNAGQMVGSQCTNYEDVVASSSLTDSEGEARKYVRYNSVTDIERVDDTEDVCKGYSNVGIGTHLGERLKDVSAIPAYFQWERKNSTEFKGANVFDFITAPTSGDGSSTATSEFMLWLEIWGGQVPIGHAEGAVATFDLYGTSFELFEGVNKANGVTVRSALPANGATAPFNGKFEGDLKLWLQAMADKGYISDSDYVNVGNAGTELFYGNSEMEAVVALEIEL